MPDKSKFILIGVIAGFVIMLFVLLQLFNYSTGLRKERDQLQDEKSALSGQLANLTNERKQLQEKLGSVKKDLEKLGADKAAVELNLQVLSQERDQLSAQVNDLKKRLAQAAEKGGESQEQQARQPQEIASAGADAYWAGVLKKKAELELTLNTLRADLKNAKLDNEQLKREKDKLSLDLQSFETDSKDSAREYSYNKKLADTLTQDLAREKTDKYQILETVKTLKSENKFLKQQLKIIFDRKTKLEQKYAELQEKNGVIESNMAKMEAFVREKIMQADSLRDELGIASAASASTTNNSSAAADAAGRKKDYIELAPIVVRPKETGAPESRSAAVIAVNRDNNFVIVNMGSNAGVKLGTRLQLYRAQEPVGIVEVIQVRDKISACDIKSETTPIAVGDIVR